MGGGGEGGGEFPKEQLRGQTHGHIGAIMTVAVMHSFSSCTIQGHHNQYVMHQCTTQGGRQYQFIMHLLSGIYRLSCITQGRQNKLIMHPFRGYHQYRYIMDHSGTHHHYHGIMHPSGADTSAHHAPQNNEYQEVIMHNKFSTSQFNQTFESMQHH